MQAFYNSSIINILKVKDQTLDTNIPNKSLINQRHDMGPVCLTGFSSFVQLDYLGSWYLYFSVDHLETGLWLLAWFHKIPFCPCRMFTQALSRPVKGGLQHNTTYHPGRHVQACKFKPYQAALRCSNIKTIQVYGAIILMKSIAFYKLKFDHATICWQSWRRFRSADVYHSGCSLIWNAWKVAKNKDLRFLISLFC